jgi:hypothetical protein
MMWLVEYDDGRISQHHEGPDTLGWDGGRRFAKVPRELDLLVERWDFERCAIVPVVEGELARIDQAHLADHGPLSIALAHIEKRIEARLILTGVQIDGMVAAEARETGQDATALARAIVAAADRARSVELERIVAKRSARGLKL